MGACVCGIPGREGVICAWGVDRAIARGWRVWGHETRPMRETVSYTRHLNLGAVMSGRDERQMSSAVDGRRLPGARRRCVVLMALELDS